MNALFFVNEVFKLFILKYLGVKKKDSIWAQNVVNHLV